MDALAQVVVWLNAFANAVCRPLLAPIGVLPGWLSATIVSAVTGVLLLVVFKYTSSQRSIKAVRNDINANLLALRLFKDSPAVAMRSQVNILFGAGHLFVLAIVPMLVMTVPVCLLLGQLSLWYQARPLHVGEEAVLTLKLNGDTKAAWPDVRLQSPDALAVTVRPVRVLSQRAICWNLKAVREGYHRLVFQADQEVGDKEVAVGDRFMRVSARRPEWQWSDVLLYPAEAPYGRRAAIQSIEIEYPRRSSWTSGSDSWVIYWFVVSMVAAFCFRGALKVNV
jgi:hypothetical protein